MPKMTKSELRWHMFRLVEQYGPEKAKVMRQMEISAARSEAAKRRHALGRGTYTKENDLTVAEVRQMVPHPWTVRRERAPGRVGGHGNWTASNGDVQHTAATGHALVELLTFAGVIAKSEGDTPLPNIL